MNKKRGKTVNRFFKRTAGALLALTIAFAPVPQLAHKALAAEGTSVVMALNSQHAFVNGTETHVNAPLNAFGSMYVDLYETAAALGVEIAWVAAEIPYYTAKGAGGSADLHITEHYDGLSAGNTLFVKNDRVYIKARDLAAIAEAPHFPRQLAYLKG